MALSLVAIQVQIDPAIKRNYCPNRAANMGRMACMFEPEPWSIANTCSITRTGPWSTVTPCPTRNRRPASGSLQIRSGRQTSYIQGESDNGK